MPMRTTRFMSHLSSNQKIIPLRIDGTRDERRRKPQERQGPRKSQNVEETQAIAELLRNNHKGVSRSTPGACKLLIPLEKSEFALADNMLCLEDTHVPNYYRKRSSGGRCGPAHGRVRTCAIGTCPC